MRRAEPEPEQHIFRGDQQKFCLRIRRGCIRHDCACYCGNKAYKEIFLKEHGISQVMQLWENMNIAVFTVGKCEQQSSLVRSGYIPDHMIEYLKDTGAVGEVCTHFIDKDGRCANQDLEDRTIAVPMEQLKNCEFRIAVILGRKGWRHCVQFLKQAMQMS